jgi:hypothetical protein
VSTCCADGVRELSIFYSFDVHVVLLYVLFIAYLPSHSSKKHDEESSNTFCLYFNYFILCLIRIYDRILGRGSAIPQRLRKSASIYGHVTSRQLSRLKFCVHLSSPMRATCPIHLDFITLFGEEYVLLSSSLCYFLFLLHPPFYVQIFSSAPCYQTPSTYVLPLRRNTKFDTHTKTSCKIKLSCGLIAVVCDRRH